MKQGKHYMSLITGEVVDDIKSVIRVIITDLMSYHFINWKWMEEEKYLATLK